MIADFLLPSDRHFSSEVHVFSQVQPALDHLFGTSEEGVHGVDIRFENPSYKVTIRIVHKGDVFVPIIHVHQRSANIAANDFDQFLEVLIITNRVLEEKFSGKVTHPHLALTLEPGVQIDLRKVKRTLEHEAIVRRLTLFLDDLATEVYIDPSAAQLIPLTHIFGGSRMLRTVNLSAVMDIALTLDSDAPAQSET